MNCGSICPATAITEDQASSLRNVKSHCVIRVRKDQYDYKKRKQYKKDRTENSCFKSDLNAVSVFSLQLHKNNNSFNHIKFDTTI